MIILDEKKNEIKQAANIIDVIGQYVPLKKNGTDYFGLCPFHPEKSPSFSVSSNKQMYFCFGCGASGDVFGYLMKTQGISFIEAARLLAEKYGIKLEQAKGCRLKVVGKTRNQKPETRNQDFIPEQAQAPGEIWQEKAGKLVMWAHDNLLNNNKRLAWLEERGIGIDMVREFKLGWNQGEDGKDICRPRESWGMAPEYKKDKKTKKILWMPIGYVIPLVVDNKVLRIRFRPDSGRPKYILLSGSSGRCMVLGAHTSRAYVLIETELDAIMVWGKVRKNKIGVIGLGTAGKHPEIETYELLKKTPVILNALDYDTAGADSVFGWWKKRFQENHKYWPAEKGKDPGEAFKAGVDIDRWVRSGLPRAWVWKSESSETIGRSDILIDKEKEQPEKEQPENVFFLKELAAIIKSSPVTIHVTPKHTWIEKPERWAQSHSDIFKRISELVFLNKELFQFLNELGTVDVDCLNAEKILKIK